ncbi:MAG: hypothetical protein ACP5JH_11065 [Bacteroidota bacterium]
MSVAVDERSRFSKMVMRYGIAFIIALFYVTVALHFNYTPDDTYIYLRFARNIAEGNGFAFNPGQPAYGVTGPLWSLLISIGSLLHLNLFVVAKILDLVLASAAIILFVLFALEVLRDHLAAVVAGFALSVNVWVLRWSGTGMETSLALLLVVSAAYAAMRNDYLLAVVLSALLTLTRPEGLLFFVILMADLVVNSVKKTRALKNMPVYLVVYVAILSPWLLFALYQFGTVIPATATAKSALRDFWSMRWWALTQEAKIFLASDLFDMAALVIGVALVTISRSPRAQSYDDRNRLYPHIFGFLWIIGLLSTYIVFGVDVVSRYFVLVIPFLIVYGFWGFLQIQAQWGALRKLGFNGLVLFAGLLLVENQLVYHRTVLPHMREFAVGMKEAILPIALWFRDNTPHQTIILTPDLGAIGYYSDRTVYDVAGLVTPEMFALRKKGFSYDEIMTRRMYRGLIAPDYIVDRAAHPDRLSSPDLLPLFTQQFPSLGISKRGIVFYTVYKVRK